MLVGYNNGRTVNVAKCNSGDVKHKTMLAGGLHH